jgi:hypothetical protein
LEEIYEELQDKDIAYAGPWHLLSTQGAQYVRFPKEVFETRAGTCIDLALLMAACIEAICIQSVPLAPVVILLRRGPDAHAIVGCWIGASPWLSSQKGKLPENLEPVLEEVDFRYVEARQVPDSLIVMDSVSFTASGSGKKTFVDCRRKGYEYLCDVASGRIEFWHALDIATARKKEILGFKI